MSQQQLPIVFQELLQLSSLGISQDAFSFANLTLESDKYICVRDGTSLVVVDLADPSNPTRLPTKEGASSIMNPESKILALRANSQMQIFHMEQQRKLKEHVMSQPVLFWKWLNSTTIGIVTESSVYHWRSDDDSAPAKVFDRQTGRGQQVQIINYRCDSTMKWLCTVGIMRGANNQIVGSMELYSVDRKVSQPIEGHACAFADYKVDGATSSSILFAFAVRNASGAKLYILEVGGQGNSGFQKRQVDIYFPPENTADFPVAMQISERYNVIYMITKFGYVYLFDLSTGTTIYLNQISSEPILVTTLHRSTNGIMGISRRGQVLSVTVDEKNMIPFVTNVLKNLPLAISLASRANLPGADGLFAAQFNDYFAKGLYKEAAKVAASSPGDSLRNMQTIQRFQALPAAGPGQASPLLQYFGELLDHGKLNETETLELARPVLQQGHKQLVEKWLGEDKLACSESLGDLARQYDLKLALQIYYKAEVKNKVIACFAEVGHYDKIVAYAKGVNYQPDWNYLLNNLVTVNPAGAVQFAQMLLNSEGEPLMPLQQIVDIFMSKNLVQETTSILLDALKPNLPEHADLQTKLLEINLQRAPQVADAILGNNMFTHYDRHVVGTLCEKAGLYQRALEHFEDISDVRRVLANCHAINQEFLVNFFSKLSPEDTLACLEDMLQANLQQNLSTVANIAAKYSEKVGAGKLVALFEGHKSYDGLYMYLSHVIKYSQDPEVHFRFIEAAVKTQQYKEVERICRESNYYDPERTKKFLMDTPLPDQLPLIIVCDRHDMVQDLTVYLYNNSMNQFIDVYVQKLNPAQTPAVVGALLDLDCNEDYIKGLIMSVRTLIPSEELVEQVEKRNRLKIILPWLESKRDEGTTDIAVYNALAKIYVDQNNDPKTYLETNQHYDSKVVGKYCENRDPVLAFIAYKRGQSDEELVDVTNRNGLFKQQAKYLVERQDQALWGTVLSENNEHRRSVIDQVVQTALPDCKSAEEVSSTVKAFMSADLPNELIELLEKIVLDGTEFSVNRNLQNLLILTAIKADKTRVMDYVNKLENYDAVDIANIAVGSDLFEEAFAIYKKFDHHTQAIEVLLGHMKQMDRAYEYAERVNDSSVFTLLAKAQLEENMVKEAIDSFVKAQDPDHFHQVIMKASENDAYEDLIRYLTMCRKKVKEPSVDSELIYAYAKTNKVAELEEFISGPNCAQLQGVGDRCFNEGMYEPAKLLFNSVSNYSRLASTLVKLKQYPAAVDAARKAKSTRTWKEVNTACVDAEEFRYAQICALHIIVHGDELEGLIRNYEIKGYSGEIIDVLESGLELERAHVGMFTELAILYSKYKPEKLMEHVKLFHARLNIPKVVRACQANQQWPELTYLYMHYDEYDNAALTMINHPVEAWESALFREVISNVSNLDICYKAIGFYLTTYPASVNGLLKSLSNRVDHSRVVDLAKKQDRLALIKPYLENVQDNDVAAVNEALNKLYIEEEDFEKLRHSILNYSNFDNLSLSQTLENHDLLEFRRLASVLYKNNSRFAQAIAIAKKDGQWKDCMEVAAASKSQEECENLLTFFVDENRPSCFAACLYHCYDYIRPDVALELAWKHNMMDFCMPYLIQTMREFSVKVQTLEKTLEDAKEASKQQQPALQMPGSMGVVAPTSVSPAMMMAAAPTSFQPGMMMGGAAPSFQPQ